MSDTIYRCLQRGALLTPDRIVYTFLSDGETNPVSISFSELDRRARAIAVRLSELNLAGQRVILSFQYGLTFIEALFGCFYAGVVPMPVYPPRPNRDNSNFNSICTASSPSAILSTAEMAAKWASQNSTLITGLPWIAVDDVSSELAPQWELKSRPSNEIALIQFSSGSTSHPKGVVITHSNIIANQKMIQSAFGHTPDSIGLGWLPMYHDMGLIGNVLQGTYVGYPTIFIPPLSFIQKPIRWLRAISNYRVTSSGGPNFGYAQCIKRIKPEDCQELDLSSWELAFTGAEPILSQTIQDFCTKFAPFGFKKSAIYPCYGLAEGTLIVTGGKKMQPPTIINADPRSIETGKIVHKKDGIPLVSSGPPLQGIELRIVNPNTGTECDEGTIGEIWISGDSVASGYWMSNQIQTEAFNHPLAGTDRRFHPTGDLGALVHGELLVTGRIKELIIIGGKNYFPHDIELTVKAIDPIFDDGSTVAFSIQSDDTEELVLIQEVRRDVSEETWQSWIRKVRAAISTSHDLALGAFILVPIGTIEKTSSGKLKRVQCKAHYSNQNLSITRQWEKQPALILKEK
ncbi:fatty acyl-AMP ligase [bacterium]|nr:fatty acyl-AMP ligase [bacterium]